MRTADIPAETDLAVSPGHQTETSNWFRCGLLPPTDVPEPCAYCHATLSSPHAGQYGKRRANAAQTRPFCPASAFKSDNQNRDVCLCRHLFFPTRSPVASVYDSRSRKTDRTSDQTHPMRRRAVQADLRPKENAAPTRPREAMSTEEGPKCRRGHKYTFDDRETQQKNGQKSHYRVAAQLPARSPKRWLRSTIPALKHIPCRHG